MATDTELGGYAIVDRIAVGGMAEVYRARASAGTQRLGEEPEEVVLKRLLPNFRADPAYAKLFVEEGRLCVRFKHPQVVRTYKLFKKATDYFMVQELVDGMSLAQLAERARSAGKPLPIAAALSAVRGLLQGLDYIHRIRFAEGAEGIVHCDVNPANVLVSSRGEVKITDFGVAVAEGTSSRGEGGSLRGTLTYMSPEQVLGRALNRRSDLFSAGLILWELLANQMHNDATSEYDAMQRARQARVRVLDGVRQDLPELLIQIVRKSVFADPALRFQDATEFLKALDVLAQRANLFLGPEALVEAL